MKRSLFILLLGMCVGLNACFWKTKKTDVPEVSAAVQTTLTAPQDAPASQADITPAHSAKPQTAQPATPETAVQTAVRKDTAPTPQTKPVSQTQPVQTAAPKTPAAPPLTETPQFKNEELISPADRYLNPLLSQGASAAEQTAPWKNEQLKYGVYYSLVKAGTAYIKNRGLVDLDGRPTYLVQTSAFSATVIDTVFKVRDINYAWIDATDFYSRGYSQSLREGNYKRDEWVIFDYKQNVYRGGLKKKGDPREIEGPLTQQVLDILSALYYVRVHPLEPGRDIVFDIINREEQYPLVVKVLKRETVKTAAGKFKCVVVEPQFRGEGIFVSKGKSLKVWLTDDEYKMPVKMKAEVFIGSVSAELLEYKRN